MAHTRKAQTRLRFTPVPSSSPSKREYPDSLQNRLANVRSDSAPRRHLRERELNSIPTPEPSSQPQQGILEENGAASASQSEGDDDIPTPAAKRRRPSANRPRQTTLTPRRSSRLQGQTSPVARPTSSGNLSSSSSQQLHSVEIPSPTPTRHPRTFRVERAPSQSSPPSRISTALSDLGSPETSGDGDEVIATKPAIQHRRQSQAIRIRDDFIVPDEDDDAPSSDDNEAPITPVRRRERNLSTQTPRSRRLKSRREHQEIQDDLDNLQDSASPQVQTSRTRGAPVNKERERRRKYIELLKRRRAGEKDSINLDPSDGAEPEEINYPANFTPGSSTAILEHHRSTRRERSSLEEDHVPQDRNLDADEDNFIVSDEEDMSHNLLGRPHPDIPLEFTSYASAKPRDLFVYVIEWLVKNKISPAFSRHDPLWKLAFSKIEDEVTAQAGSRLKSSAWTGPFTIALNARPGLTTTEAFSTDDFLRTCDACNRTNYPAKYEFVFSGSAYHHDSLDPVEPDSASEIEADNEHETTSVDSRGRTLPSLTAHFFLGRYCAANAELAHRFTHWKYNLNEEVIGHLESQGVLSAEEIVRRERSKGGQRKREKEAEEIVDGMKNSGVIEELWKGFKDDLEDARIGMEGHERKGGRGSKRIGSVRVPISQVTRVDDGDVERSGEMDFGGRFRKEESRKKSSTTISVSDDEDD